RQRLDSRGGAEARPPRILSGARPIMGRARHRASRIMKPTIVLFDIDGTLITTGGVGRRAIELAFEELFGSSDACSHFRFDGMTDRAIMRGGLAALKREGTDAEIDRLVSVYVRHLETTVAAAPAHSYRV